MFLLFAKEQSSTTKYGPSPSPRSIRCSTAIFQYGLAVENSFFRWFQMVGHCRQRDRFSRIGIALRGRSIEERARFRLIARRRVRRERRLRQRWTMFGIFIQLTRLNETIDASECVSRCKAHLLTFSPKRFFSFLIACV